MSNIEDYNFSTDIKEILTDILFRTDIKYYIEHLEAELEKLHGSELARKICNKALIESLNEVCGGYALTTLYNYCNRNDVDYKPAQETEEFKALTKLLNNYEV